VSQYPYCGSFQPPPESGLAPSHNDWADGVTVNPPVNNQTVFECKYEIDSLCGFLKLSRAYYGATKDASFMNANCMSSLYPPFTPSCKSRFAHSVRSQGTPPSRKSCASSTNSRSPRSTPTLIASRTTTGRAGTAR
jgi:hypothetical protein